MENSIILEAAVQAWLSDNNDEAAKLMGTIPLPKQFEELHGSKDEDWDWAGRFDFIREILGDEFLCGFWRYGQHMFERRDGKASKNFCYKPIFDEIIKKYVAEKEAMGIIIDPQ